MTENLQRITQKIFGSNAGNQGITAYGSPATGNTIYTKDLNEIQTPAFEIGKEAGFVSGKCPVYTDDTGIDFVITKQLAYLLQKGVAEWDSNTTYFQGDICQVKTNNIPTLFYSLIDNNLNNNPANSLINWFNLNTMNFTGLNLNTPIDFNTYTQQGNYNLSSNLHTNAPIDTEFACNLQVLTDGSTLNVVQLVQDLTNSTSYVRYRLNDVWGNWGVNDFQNSSKIFFIYMQ